MVDMPCTKRSFALAEALWRQCFGRTERLYRPREIRIERVDQGARRDPLDPSLGAVRHIATINN